MSTTEAELDVIATVLARAALDPEDTAVHPAVLQSILRDAVRIYARYREGGVEMSPFPGSHGRGDTPTASEVCVAAVGMLDAVSVEVFELGMWKTWAAISGGDAQHLD